jgi:hypothetical protein
VPRGEGGAAVGNREWGAGGANGNPGGPGGAAEGDPGAAGLEAGLRPGRRARRIRKTTSATRPAPAAKKAAAAYTLFQSTGGRLDCAVPAGACPRYVAP